MNGEVISVERKLAENWLKIRLCLFFSRNVFGVTLNLSLKLWIQQFPKKSLLKEVSKLKGRVTRFQTSPFPPRFRINTTPSHTHAHTHTHTHSRTHTRTHAQAHIHNLTPQHATAHFMSKSQTNTLLSFSVCVAASLTKDLFSARIIHSLLTGTLSLFVSFSLYDTLTPTPTHWHTLVLSLTHASNSKFSWKMIILLRPLSFPQKINRLPDNQVPLFGKKYFETF